MTSKRGKKQRQRQKRKQKAQHQRKKQRKPARRTRQHTDQPLLLYTTSDGIGVDYSVPLRVALVSYSGIGELTEAGVVALAYGFNSDARLGVLPMVSLVCTNAAVAKKAWDVFELWQEGTDGDAVSLSWVFRPDGSYRLIVSAESDRYRFRMRGFRRSPDELLISPTYIKQFDSTSEPTKEFREYLRKRCSPFFFAACTTGMEPIGKPLLKFEATEADESELPAGSPERIYLRLEEAPEPTVAGSEDGAHWRSKVLAEHFPVTKARLSRADAVPLLQEAISAGFQRWQIEQAVANLVLSSELTSGHQHYLGLPTKSAAKAIVARIQGRREVADSKPLNELLTDGRLIKQLVLDSNALLQSVGSSAGQSSIEVIQKLKDANLISEVEQGS